MNQRLKRAFERAAVVSGLPRVVSILNSGRSIVLMYHNIVPSGVERFGDLSLHLAQHEFAAHLDLFERHFAVVPLIDLLDDHASPAERPRIAITFDDAYVGALTVGVQELVSRRTPATIFVPPGLLGREPWWDLVASRTSEEIPSDERRGLLVALGGRQEAILARRFRRRSGSRIYLSSPPPPKPSEFQSVLIRGRIQPSLRSIRRFARGAHSPVRLAP